LLEIDASIFAGVSRSIIDRRRLAEILARRAVSLDNKKTPLLAEALRKWSECVTVAGSHLMSTISIDII
jgi:hypothetical protein